MSWSKKAAIFRKKESMGFTVSMTFARKMATIGSMTTQTLGMCQIPLYRIPDLAG